MAFIRKPTDITESYILDFILQNSEPNRKKGFSTNNESVLESMILRRMPGVQEQAMIFYDQMCSAEISKNKVIQYVGASAGYVSILSRMFIRCGMSAGYAIALNDIFLKRLGTCSEEKDFLQWAMEAIDTFMEFLPKLPSVELAVSEPGVSYTSKHVKRTIDYVLNHLSQSFTLQTIADELEISSHYLSSLFHKETGMTFTEYVRRHRIEVAKFLLIHTDLSCVEIAQLLCFSSQSHFIKTFKELAGITPKAFADSAARGPEQKK